MFKPALPRPHFWSPVTPVKAAGEVQVGGGADEGSSAHLGPAVAHKCRPICISQVFLCHPRALDGNMGVFTGADA